MNPEMPRSSPLLVRRGNFFFHYGMACSRSSSSGSRSPTSTTCAVRQLAHRPLVDTIGLAVALAGQLLRAVTIGFAYVRRGGLRRRSTPTAWSQDGLFAHSRNPLYVGNFLACSAS